MTTFLDVLLIFIPALFASVFSYFVCRFCKAQGLFDTVSQRSAHTVETLRGGGLTFIVPTLVFAVFWLFIFRETLTLFHCALLIGSAAIALLGFVEDKKGVPTGVRLLFEILIVSGMVFFLPPMFEGVLGFWGAKVIIVLAWVWFLNLYNFMDGLNTYATGFAIFLAVILSFFGSSFHGVLLVLVGSCIGFLRVNTTPAKIFMGDCGSLFLGTFLGGVMFELLSTDTHLWFFPLLTLSLVFTFDATYTLVCRLFKGVSPAVPHNGHLYQRASRLGLSHEKVTLYATGLSFFFFVLATLQLLTRFDFIIFLCALGVCFCVIRYMRYLEGN